MQSTLEKVRALMQAEPGLVLIQAYESAAKGALG